MIIAFITLITALLLAAVAAWFSVIGIVSFFSGQILLATIMGCVLELGKIVTATWLKHSWNETSWILKAPLIFIFVALMFITSMGIFTFLSKAHVEQGAESINNSSKIEFIDQQLIIFKARQTDARGSIKQLDDTVNSLITHDKISGNSGAKTVRQQQKSERETLEKEISDEQKKIDDLNTQRFELDKSVKNFNLELGPVKYLAQLLYDNPDQNVDKAVRLFILLIIFVFDPLAVLLLVGANQTFINRLKKKQQPMLPITPVPTNTEIAEEVKNVDSQSIVANLQTSTLPITLFTEIEESEKKIDDIIEPSIEFIREQLINQEKTVNTDIAKTKDEIDRTPPELRSQFIVRPLNK